MLEDSLNRSCDEGGSHDAPVDSEMLLRELKELLADKDRILDSFVHKLHIQ